MCSFCEEVKDTFKQFNYHKKVLDNQSYYIEFQWTRGTVGNENPSLMIIIHDKQLPTTSRWFHFKNCPYCGKYLEKLKPKCVKKR